MCYLVRMCVGNELNKVSSILFTISHIACGTNLRTAIVNFIRCIQFFRLSPNDFSTLCKRFIESQHLCPFTVSFFLVCDEFGFKCTPIGNTVIVWLYSRPCAVSQTFSQHCTESAEPTQILHAAHFLSSLLMCRFSLGSKGITQESR